MKYDAIIIGAGPAGVFAAISLAKQSLSVALIDKGSRIHKRKCPTNSHKNCTQKCTPCSTMCGFGGAGAFSDGKLNIAKTLEGDTRIGTYLSLDEFKAFIQEVDDIWLSYGASPIVFGKTPTENPELYDSCKKAGLTLLDSKIRHLGTECSAMILEEIQNDLENKVDFIFNKEVHNIIIKDGKAYGVELNNGQQILSKYIAAFPGRDGAAWFENQCKRLHLNMQTHPVDIGVRVETHAEVMNHLTSILYEPKIFYHPSPFRDQVRTFCVCPNGEVTVETVKIDGHSVTSVNGHSYQNKKTENTNFALLTKVSFTEPFNQPTLYASHFAHAANLLSGSVLIQRLGDILAGRRSTDIRIKKSGLTPTLESAVPGDISLAMPYRPLMGLIETIRAMEKVAPGILSMTDTFFYGLEVKYYSSSPLLSSDLETEIPNLFAGGDGAGVSRNLVHASVCGLKIANVIKERVGN